MTKVVVDFNVPDNKVDAFAAWLQRVTGEEDYGIVEGYRADDHVSRRRALQAFADEMELTLRRHDHKTGWREKAIDALFRLLLLEVEEAKVAMEFFNTREARAELIDVANFCLIVYDRLGAYKEDDIVPAVIAMEASNRLTSNKAEQERIKKEQGIEPTS